MARMNWERANARDHARRSGHDVAFPGRAKGAKAELAEINKVLRSFKRPKQPHTFWLTIKCFNCGHLGAAKVKRDQSLPNFKCSRCGRKGYPHARTTKRARP